MGHNDGVLAVDVVVDGIMDVDVLPLRMGGDVRSGSQVGGDVRSGGGVCVCEDWGW